jgi:hypothetical protein
LRRAAFGFFVLYWKMKIDFSNLLEHIIPISDFELSWRFTEERYNVLPEIHLNQLRPLDKLAANFLSNYISEIGLHNHVPFKKDFFKVIDEISSSNDNESEIKKWLYRRGLPFGKEVCVVWNHNEAMIVPWKLLIKYFDDFAYPGSDDLTVFDESLNWALLFFHEGEIYFGSNEKFIPENPIELGVY